MFFVALAFFMSYNNSACLPNCLGSFVNCPNRKAETSRTDQAEPENGGVLKLITVQETISHVCLSRLAAKAARKMQQYTKISRSPLFLCTIKLKR